MAVRLRIAPWPNAEKPTLLAVLFVAVIYIVISKHPDLPWSQDRHITLAHAASWSRFAYATYATTEDALCNSLMLIASLRALEVQPDLLLLHSDEWSADSDGTGSTLLRLARDRYKAQLQPIQLLTPGNVTDLTWSAGFTKLLAFNQTQYDRVLMLDSDGTVLRSMDELFLSPPSPVAVPRAYWLDDHFNAKSDRTNGTDGWIKLSTQMMLVHPSSAAFKAIKDRIEAKQPDEYDMEIVNAVFGASCSVLPHRPYDLLTGEFRKSGNGHAAYLGGRAEAWDAEAVIREAKYVHFSDWPLPKPWRPMMTAALQKLEPSCGECAEKRIWRWLYDDFRTRRKGVCGAQYASWELYEQLWNAEASAGVSESA